MRTLVVFIALSAIAVPDRPAPPENVANELAKLDGTWAVVSFEWDGGKHAEADLANYPKHIMKNGTWRWDNSTSVGTMKVDATQAPKAIDFVHGDGDFKGRLQLGIYEFQGDTFRDCIAPKGKERPREFSVPPGSGQTLMVFLRVKE